MSGELTVGKVGKETGLSAKTIRFYEDAGLLPRARRSESGYRLYAEADVMRLHLVRRLKANRTRFAGDQGARGAGVRE